MTVTVLPVNDAPIALDATYETTRNSSIVIDFAALVSDVDSSMLALSIEQPDHGNLIRNADGTFTYGPRKGFTGVDTFTYTVSDGSLTDTGVISVQVLPVSQHPDDDDDYHGACIVVHSKDPNAAPFGIDWDGRPDDGFMSLPLDQPGWLPEFLGVPPRDDRSLAEITGLVVKVEG